MALISAKLTVFFEEPFWIGVYERTENQKLEVCKILFGAEPKDYEVYEYLLKNFSKLKFSPSVWTEKKVRKPINPKRLQREISKQLHETGLGTKAQQALKLQQQEMKTERKLNRKKKTEEEKQRQFDLKQKKKKQKHRGR
ncbi:YjdF family protein [Anaerovorax sp. IOR16]|uniref:YjdF family protein n=1 Tax=Anaerovorax sp. IOR16 TaxID=2773458 RepID=UPI0019D07D1E|nr:YjdF family protein [Anaerovorax sp. IOR16]